LASLWTPHAAPDWAGCREDCNNCGHACPTGAIRALSLEEKRAARMGRAVVSVAMCLPHSGRQECGMCAARCPYEAIELRPVRAELAADGQPVEGTGFSAPTVLPDKCVGCGKCQEACYRMNHLEWGLLPASAIAVEAGPGKEDRLSRGSYVALRETALPRNDDR
jgi:ferredoxin